MAERNRLKLERERGNLISCDDHETELGARAAFFRREIETFGPHLAPRLIALVGGQAERREDLLHFWTEETEIWMDAWAQGRAFVAPVEVIGLDGDDQADLALADEFLDDAGDYPEDDNDLPD